MLAPNDRHVLLDLLRPPPGYRLDGAIGTTFTLSLETALVVPLAFASFRLSGTSDPIAVMEAVRAAADRVDVFCQAGQMTVPRRSSGLFAFLERMVHEVRRPRPGHLFHPKVWFLRYLADDGQPQVRLLCLTRNLTDDSCWDVALRLDGSEGRQPDADNRPLGLFLAALPDMAVRGMPEARAQRVESLVQAARRAHWETPEHVTHKPVFWPFGIDRLKDRPDFGGYRHLVVAPFVNAAGLAEVAPDPGSNVTLVSRVEELDRFESHGLKTIAQTLVVSAAADLDDPDAADDLQADRDRLTGLHAKVFVVERNRAAHIFVGSANATGAAFTGNVEFLVELTAGATRLGVDRFLDAEEGLGAILEPYATDGGLGPDPLDEARRLLRDVLRAVAEQRFKATVLPDAERYVERIQAPPIVLPPEVALAVELLTLPGSVAQMRSTEALDAQLGPVDLDQVTPFVLVYATTAGPGGEEVRQATVVRCELVDDPEGRLDEILARQVDTPEKFLRFLLLILGIADPSSILGDDGPGASGSWGFAHRSNGLFELLTRAAADRPDVLDDLERLVPRLRATSAGAAVLPPGFDQIWDVIQAARPGLHAVTAAART